jgi:ATP/maltotriose-dependent transcriptional regulator MalT
MHSALLLACADIVCARGDLKAAYHYTERGLARGREGVDPQLLYPAIAMHARMAFASGRSAEAARLVDELQRLAGEQRLPAGPWFFFLVAVLVGLDRRDEAADLIREIRHPTPWVEAAQALVEGRPSEAGDRLEAMGARAEAALVRLRAGQALLEDNRPSEAAEQLDRAVEFFRSVGATAYLEEAEPLLGAA